MSIKRPSFMDSEYFVMEDENWHLKPGAPDNVIKEFEEFMKYKKETEERDIAI